MNRDLLLPHFLGIGAVKAGTTWLHRNLYAHPDLYLPVQKPVYFFDRHFERGIESYSRIFRPGKGKLRGEFSASYSVLPRERIEAIREFVPHMKLILLLREPRSRDWSEARMEHAVVRNQPLEETTEQDYLQFLHSEKCRSRGDYVGILQQWRSVFPHEQMFVDLYDRVAEDPHSLLLDIFNFLGAALPESWEGFPVEQTIFKGHTVEMPTSCRQVLEQRYDNQSLAAIAQASGLPVDESWHYDRSS